MIQALIAFLRGELICLVRGKNLHRFINLCMKYGIVFQNVVYKNDFCLELRMFLSDFYRIKPYVRKTHVKVKIKERKGIPFLFHRYRTRVAFVLVVLLSAVGIVCLSLRIWKIEIIGNSSLSEETLLEYLKEHAVSYGVEKSRIDNDALELSLRQDFEPIIWSSVYQKGTKLVVCVQEKLVTEQKKETGDEVTDLVASCDATISSIITRSGTPLVKAKDVVHKGDILVSGRQEILGDDGEVKQYYESAADADVYGCVSYPYEKWLPVEEEIVVKTGKSHNSYDLLIGTKELRFPMLYAMFDSYESVEDNTQLQLMDYFYFPVFLGKTTYYETKYETVSYSYEEIKAKAKEQVLQFLSEMEENGVSILDKHVMIEKDGESYHVYGTIEVSEPIAQSVPAKSMDSVEAPSEEMN